jgi:hypothetical protein
MLVANHPDDVKGMVKVLNALKFMPKDIEPRVYVI